MTAAAAAKAPRPTTCGEYVQQHAGDVKFAATVGPRAVTCQRLPMHKGDCRATLTAPKPVREPKAPKAPKAPSPKQVAARQAFAAAAKARHEAKVAKDAAKVAPAKSTHVTIVAPGKGRAPKAVEPKAPAKDARQAIGLLVEAGIISPSVALSMIAAL